MIFDQNIPQNAFTIIIGHEKFYPMETMKVQYSNCHECDKWINIDMKDKTKKKKYPTENNAKNCFKNCKKKSQSSVFKSTWKSLALASGPI